MVPLLSWKFRQYFFESSTPSASMLTWHRRVADTMQTLTLTKLLTLNEKDASGGVLSGRNGITTFLLKKAVIAPLFCFF